MQFMKTAKEVLGLELTVAVWTGSKKEARQLSAAQKDFQMTALAPFTKIVKKIYGSAPRKGSPDWKTELWLTSAKKMDLLKRSFCRLRKIRKMTCGSAQREQVFFFSKTENLATSQPVTASLVMISTALLRCLPAMSGLEPLAVVQANCTTVNSQMSPLKTVWATTSFTRFCKITKGTYGSQQTAVSLKCMGLKCNRSTWRMDSPTTSF